MLFRKMASCSNASWLIFDNEMHFSDAALSLLRAAGRMHEVKRPCFSVVRRDAVQKNKKKEIERGFELRKLVIIGNAFITPPPIFTGLKKRVSFVGYFTELFISSFICLVFRHCLDCVRADDSTNENCHSRIEIPFSIFCFVTMRRTARSRQAAKTSVGTTEVYDYRIVFPWGCKQRIALLQRLPVRQTYRLEMSLWPWGK